MNVKTKMKYVIGYKNECFVSSLSLFQNALDCITFLTKTFFFLTFNFTFFLANSFKLMTQTVEQIGLF